MRIKLNLVLLLIFTSLFSVAQENYKIELESKHLEEKRDIEIYLPPEYETSLERDFPVMYILDGQEYFYYPIAYQNMLRFKNKTPAFIVIGIHSDRQKRRSLYQGEAEKFIDFLQQELVPYIDSNYRTLKEKERIYFGWEMAGGLGLELFNKDPWLFSAYFIASPTHFSSERLENLSHSFDQDLGHNTFFYITRANAKDDEFMEPRFVQLREMIQEKSPKNTNWKFDLLEYDSHYSTPNKTIHNGLKLYFNDYDPIRFFSMEDYRNYGEMDAIEAYYTNRAERYQVSDEIHRETKHFLFLQAFRDDDFKQFDYFATTFPGHLETRLSNDFWVNRFADFYMKHQQEDKALELYKHYLETYPNSALIYNGMGNAYKQQGKRKQAKVAYKRAIELAKSQADPNLEMYQVSLKEL